MNGLMTTLRQPRFWLIAAALATATGVALGNGWLTGAALLSLFIALAPCLLMCGLGLCMMKCSKGSKKDSCDSKVSSAPTPDIETPNQRP